MDPECPNTTVQEPKTAAPQQAPQYCTPIPCILVIQCCQRGTTVLAPSTSRHAARSCFAVLAPARQAAKEPQQRKPRAAVSTSITLQRSTLATHQPDVRELALKWLGNEARAELGGAEAQAGRGQGPVGVLCQGQGCKGPQVGAVVEVAGPQLCPACLSPSRSQSSSQSSSQSTRDPPYRG